MSRGGGGSSMGIRRMRARQWSHSSQQIGTAPPSNDNQSAQAELRGPATAHRRREQEQTSGQWRETQSVLHCTRAQHARTGWAAPSGNHSAISFCADSTASEPWMMLRPTSIQ